MKSQLPEHVLAAIHTLPSLPAVVTELMARLGDDQVERGAVARKIAADPVLTARLLRLANSSFYGLSRQVRTVDEAVAIVGLRSLSSLVATAAVISRLAIGPDSAIAFEPYWRHAVGAALHARALAAHKGADPESAYVAGLLHDIGRLVLATRFATRYRDVQDRQRDGNMPLVQAENSELGLDHAMVGGALARHWNFPEPIRQAIAQHHDTSHPAPDTMVLIVQAADALIQAPDCEGAEHAMDPPIDRSAWDRLELDEDALRAVASQADQGFALACSMLY